MSSWTLIGREEKQPSKMLKEAGHDTFFAEADISKSSEVEKVVRAAVWRYGKIDVLVNNAGIFLGGSVVEVSEESWDRVISVNLKGVFLCSKSVVREMLRAGGGVVVNIASILGLVGSEGEAAYCASKRGVVALTRAMALNFARCNISLDSCYHRKGYARVSRRRLEDCLVIIELPLCLGVIDEVKGHPILHGASYLYHSSFA